MSLEENKAKVRKVIEAINEQNLDLLDSITAPDYFDHTHQLNLEGDKQFKKASRHLLCLSILSA
jgi:hypothetical protein